MRRKSILLIRATGEINWQLREAREKRMWSEEQAARKVGVDLQTYHRWETGKQGIRLSSLKMLCAAFGEFPENLGFGTRFTKCIMENDDIMEENEELEEELAPTTPPPAAEHTDDGQVKNKLLSSATADTQLPASVQEMQSRFEQRIKREIDNMSPRNDAGNTFSRRQTLAMLASLPLSMRNFTQGNGSRSPLLSEEEILSLYTIALPACWRLFYEQGRVEVERLLPHYLADLTHLAQRPTKNQKIAANLASQAYQLKTSLALQQEDFGTALSYCRQGVFYGQLAGDANLIVGSLIRNANIHFYRKRPLQELQALQEAVRHVKDASPLLRGHIYSELAETYGHLQQEQEVSRSIGLARDTYPNDPEGDTSYAYTHSNHYIMFVEEGLAYLHLKKYKDAWKAFQLIETVVPKISAVRRAESDVYLARALTGLKDLDQSHAYLERALQTAMAISSDLFYNEACDAYQQMVLQWPHESKVKQLGDLFQEWSSSKPL